MSLFWIARRAKERGCVLQTSCFTAPRLLPSRPFLATPRPSPNLILFNPENPVNPVLHCLPKKSACAAREERRTLISHWQTNLYVSGKRLTLRET
jgi:hypothetical protein